MSSTAASTESKIVILDRDGVINEDSDDYIKSLAEWVPIPGSIDAIARLSQAGYTVVVASNQSGIARQLFDEFELARIHQTLCGLVESAGGTLHGIFYCPHGPEADCDCRKPAIGLLTRIECEFGVSVQNAPFVGDSMKDLIAARLAGCRPVLVKTGKGLQTQAEASENELDGVDIFDDLAAFVDTFTGKAA
ncbi:MAG: D-glycero-beta-D-manno-heptose 1,7-bisphosphate 7-phosphatase [Pseudomonadales bacterium]|nr:D-glycero-beta-D-manno-heptose 1,7-bisphosphate 7-phosphatase [Pseudomonadales bacterium]